MRCCRAGDPAPCRSGASERVLHDLAALHYQRHVAPVLDEERDIVQRIAVDRDKVGGKARGDAPETVLLADDLGVDAGRAAQDLERAHDLAAERKLDAFM